MVKTLTWGRMRWNSNVAVSEEPLQQKTHLGGVLLKETPPLPQGDFFGC